VGLRLTLGLLTISPSRVSPFHHIGTLSLPAEAFPTMSTPSRIAVHLNGTHLPGTLGKLSIHGFALV